MTDLRALLGRLPSDVGAVAGIPRSGMLPASFLATMLHLPLFAVREGGLQEVGAGLRLFTPPMTPRGRRLLVIDDSVYGGAAVDRARRWLRHLDVPKTFCSIYVRPEAASAVDLFGRLAPHPHLFEWNLFNCNQSTEFAFDMDGVLCADWTGGEEDGPEYLNFLQQARPRWLPRRRAVQLIVTARLEQHRLATMEWLERHGVFVHRLVMGPWKSAAERRRHYDPALHKGRAFQESECTMFIESDPRQAWAIFQEAQKPVLCPTTGEIFQ